MADEPQVASELDAGLIDPGPETGSLAEFEAQFPRGGTAPAPISADPDADAVPPPVASERRPRHRARSQQASVEDAPRIAELTKKLRTAETELAEIKKAPPVVAPAPVAASAPAPLATLPAEFPEAEPAWTEFEGKSPDAYSDWILARGAHARRKEQFVATQKWQAEEQKRRDTAAQTAQQDRERVFRERETAYAATDPGYLAAKQKSAEDKIFVSPLTWAGIQVSSTGPQEIKFLATHPEIAAELLLITDGKAISDSTVASAQRWLTTRMQAAPTGSAAPTAPLALVPRPPNPVRTGPLNTGDKPLGDNASVNDFEKAYHPEIRRAKIRQA